MVRWVQSKWKNIVGEEEEKIMQNTIHRNGGIDGYGLNEIMKFVCFIHVHKTSFVDCSPTPTICYSFAVLLRKKVLQGTCKTFLLVFYSSSSWSSSSSRVAIKHTCLNDGDHDDYHHHHKMTVSQTTTYLLLQTTEKIARDRSCSLAFTWYSGRPHGCHHHQLTIQTFYNTRCNFFLSRWSYVNNFICT